MNKKATPESPAVENFLNIDEVDASGASRKYQLLEEETRLKLIIDSMLIVGLEDYKGDDGKVTTNYKIGINFTSNREQRYDDGEGSGRKVTFFKMYTFSFHEKSGLIKGGLIDALGYDITASTKLTDFLAGCVGQQVSAMINHRKYKTKQGQDAVAMDIEKFKAVKDKEDFDDSLSSWTVPYLAKKSYPDKKIVTWLNLKNRTAPKIVSDYTVGEVAVAGKIVDLV